MRMMERALRLRPGLNTFFNDVQNRWETDGLCDRTKPAVLQYRLSAYDWKVIEVLVKLLKPFEIATKQLQGNGVPAGRSTCGSFDEYFPVFEVLLDHLESAIEGTIFEEVEDPVTREKKDVELGWKKLHKYYSRLTSAAYVGAVVFNPAKKWRLLDQLWSRVPSRKTKSWRLEYEAKLLEIWETYRERDVDNEVLVTSDEASMDYIERRLARTVAGSPFNQGSLGASGARKSSRKTKSSTAGGTGDDEYARYCAEDVVNSHHYRSRPIDWWKINRNRYPRLSLMAVDMLTIPSTSAESERTFSSAGRKRTIDQMFSLASTETPDVDFQFRNRLKKQFDKAVFQRKLVRWIVETNQSFRVSENDTFRDLLDYLDPISVRPMPKFPTLRSDGDAVHIAFDGWTSRNRNPLFGVVAFFLDQSFRPRKIVLGLPNLTDRHTGENIADSVRDILEAFELGKEKIGYFTLDNASNNDKAMDHLAQHFSGATPRQGGSAALAMSFIW
ncbi:hypothetical protein VFPBJ_11577 [Purpureocillium lilacinum]|uniref:HAT C-terminal dimerisation domain-containing protein n=1 Tax=Purpureocillium lilacinum TaxID=33203 RepID=A0A179F4M2_PURLI|nr:hypothetical protein VFPBJ_11577 [Purpureocillium lilacinum]